MKVIKSTMFTFFQEIREMKYVIKEKMENKAARELS